MSCCDMHMTFFWSYDLGKFFFKGLKVNSIVSLIIVCVVLALLSVLYEGIKVLNAYNRAKIAREQIAAVSCAPSESANLLVTENNSNSFSKRFCRLINETIIFLFHNTLGYGLMLAVMAYNGWLFLAVVLSMGLGYFFFGHIAIKVNMESIQARTRKVVCTPVCSPACAEAGVSGIQRNNPTACGSGPQTSNSQASSNKGCHENKTMCEIKSKNVSCCEVNQTSSAVLEDTDDNCSCRL